MSRKNHVMTDRGLLQTDKKFSALKERQKVKIAEWMYEAYRNCYLESGRIPQKGKEGAVLSYVFQTMLLLVTDRIPLKIRSAHGTAKLFPNAVYLGVSFISAPV